MTIVALVAAAAVSAALAWRMPAWGHLLAALAVAAGAASLAALAGLERALMPLALLAGAAGWLIPAGPGTGRHLRVAPRKGGRAAGGKGGRARKGDDASDGGFEGVEVPGFDILEKVGSGGMASVYRARRRSDGTTVALKVPMEQYVADAKFIRRFHREAEVAQRLDHANIVRTYEHGAQGVQHYMAMEFVDGRSLESYVEAREL
ncbi:MAG: protein kinase, partial [Trueperaceae bacterium]